MVLLSKMKNVDAFYSKSYLIVHRKSEESRLPEPRAICFNFFISQVKAFYEIPWPKFNGLEFYFIEFHKQPSEFYKILWENNDGSRKFGRATS